MTDRDFLSETLVILLSIALAIACVVDKFTLGLLFLLFPLYIIWHWSVDYHEPRP